VDTDDSKDHSMVTKANGGGEAATMLDGGGGVVPRVYMCRQ